MSGSDQKYFEGVGDIWLNNGMAHMSLLSTSRDNKNEEPAPHPAGESGELIIL